MSYEPRPADPIAAQAQTPSLRLDVRKGRWIEHWNPEDTGQWEREGRSVARRNLRWSVFAEFLGFVVWQLWSIVVVQLPAAGFHLSTPETFWLISMPSLVGATLRVPYTFMVPRFGGRNWTVISAALLLVPVTGLALCVSDPTTPFWAMLLVAALAGFGGGNFASSMANITFFFPAREKGWALGLNAAGGNLGAAVAQLVVPIAVSLTAAVVSGAGLAAPLAMAGLLWVPLILVAATGAWRNMDNLANAKGDLTSSLAALREPHLWVMAFLYIGTFGSFIGFSGVFPKLINDFFPEYSSLTVNVSGAAAALSLAFLGPLIGSLTRPCGGRLADRFGGARMAVMAFASMATITVALIATLPLRNFWLFLALFLALFTASGFGNGATYRMIPVIFAAKSRLRAQDAHSGASPENTAKPASAALGLISAIGAYGGFFIPQVLSASSATTGSYIPAFAGFVAAYAVMLVVAWACYLRRGSLGARAGV